MTLDDIKEKISERAKEIATRIAENERFISLMEWFHNLSPIVQKVIVISLVFFIGFGLYSIPSAYIDSAKNAEESFATNRQLLRGLYRVARNPNLPPDRFAGPSFTEMKSKVDSLLAQTQVLDSQKGNFAPVNRPLAGSTVPREIRQEGMEFEIKKLNLKQVVALSEKVSSLHPNTKLASVQINADPTDPHYFNVKYTLSSLSVPIKQTQPAAGNNSFKKK